jgi:hypothetical protein
MAEPQLNPGETLGSPVPVLQPGESLGPPVSQPEALGGLRAGETLGPVVAAPEPSVWNKITDMFTLLGNGERTGTHYEAAPNQDTPDVRLGKMVPESSVPALSAIKKYAVDPFNNLADKGRKAGEAYADFGQPNMAGAPEWLQKTAGVERGVQRGVYGAVGSTVADPRNWPFFASGAARPILQKIIGLGFTGMMSKGAIDTTKELHDHWDRLTPEQRAQLATGAGINGLMATGGLLHAAPLDSLLHDPPPAEVRIVDSSAARDQMVANDTVHPVSPRAEETYPAPGGVTHVYENGVIRPVDAVEAGAQASVRSSPDVAPLRTARIVSDDHVPVVSQNEILSKAINDLIANSDELQKIGIDPSKINSSADAEAMLAQAADHIRQNMDPRANAVIGFELQKQLAAERNMTVEELLSRKSGQAFNAEEAIAARALLNDSGINVVKAARAAVLDKNAMPDLTRALSQHQLISNAVDGMSAEAGRALGSFNVQDLPASRIANAMSKLPEDAKAKAAELLTKIDPENPRQLDNFIQQITPNSTADKIFEFYRNSLLSGPATVIKKGASELTMLALESMKKLTAAGISGIKGGEDQRFASESYWFAKGAIDGLSHAKEVLNGSFDLADMPSFERTGQQAIKGTVGNIVRLPSTVLSRQTNLMFVLNYFGELNSQAARQAIKEGLTGTELAARQEYLVHNPTADMIAAAHDTGLHNTFQTDLGKFGKKIQGALKADPTGIAKYLVPFFRTPINLVKESSYFSPYGLFKGLATGDPDMQARGLVGSSLAAGIAYLAANGYITGGGPVDVKKKDTLEATGWQPYSVKIGDRYYSYRRLEPLGLAFSLVADAVHSVKMNDPEVVTQSKADAAVNHIARSLQDVAFVPTLSNLSEALTNPGTRAEGFISRQVASVVPALVKDVAQGIDPVVRKPVGPTQTIESRIPGLTSRVPAVINVAGQPVKRPTSVLGGANPFPVSKANGDAVLKELARLGVSTTQAPATVKRRGKPVQLTESQRQQITMQENQQLYRKLAGVVAGSRWKNMSDDKKRGQIADYRKEIAETRPARIARLPQ